MRPRTVVLIWLAVFVVAGTLAVPQARHRLARVVAAGATATGVDTWLPDPHTAPQAAPPGPTLRAPAGPLSVPETWYLGWALLDRASGTVTGSANRATSTNSTESMIKPWIAADHLRLASAAKRTPGQAELADLTAMITRSDDNAAERYYVRNGADATVSRLIDLCGLTRTTIYQYWWSRTQMSPEDAVRMGRCLADGTAAGPTWTAWLLDTMRKVTGTAGEQTGTTGGGRWGIIDGLPASLAAETSIKNGWTPIGADGLWHVDCLAIHPAWVLAIMMRYPVGRGLQYGADTCAAVTRQLVVTPDL